MPPPSLPSGSLRSAAVINEEIRQLWRRAPLSPEDEARYRVLLVEWAEACGREGRQADVSPAA